MDITDTSPFTAVADTMGTVGPDHFVELLNNTIAVYDKSGALVEGPMHSADFFVLQDNGTTYPVSDDVVDPRIIYDHQSQRWIACALDRIDFSNILLAISEDSQPVPLLANWRKYRVAKLKRQNDPADFPTLGIDANGIYISVIYEQSRSNAVAAIHKAQAYQGVYQDWMLPTESAAPARRIIQPSVNFDATPTGNYAWLIAKDPPEYDAMGYKGGPVVYRRIQWNGGVPSWADAQWITVGEPNPTYRDYFDLDEGDPQNGAPQAGTPLFPDPIKIRVDGSGSAGVGSRLSMAVIRDGILWTCHHVGLDGVDGVYDGDKSGGTVDRSAVQWIRLEIDGNGHLVAVNNQSHGRFYDDCDVAPYWYYFPSLMVNAAGDMVVGFSGSNENTYIDAFYAWRLANGTVSSQPRLIKHGEYYYGNTRWGDYSNTCLDPSDSLSFWSVLEYAGFPQIQGFEWGTWISKLIPVP